MHLSLNGKAHALNGIFSCRGQAIRQFSMRITTGCALLLSCTLPSMATNHSTGQGQNETIIASNDLATLPKRNVQKEGVSSVVRDIRGRVTDEKGEGLPGVSIVVKGTQRGVITETEGKYQIDVPDDNTTLIFSFVGYITEEIAVGNRTSIDVSMRVDERKLEKLVVVGYGVQKKSDLTGAVSSVPMRFVKDQPVRSLSDILQGRVAGMTLSRTSGRG